MFGFFCRKCSLTTPNKRHVVIEHISLKHLMSKINYINKEITLVKENDKNSGSTMLVKHSHQRKKKKTRATDKYS